MRGFNVEGFVEKLQKEFCAADYDSDASKRSAFLRKLISALFSMDIFGPYLCQSLNDPEILSRAVNFDASDSASPYHPIKVSDTCPSLYTGYSTVSQDAQTRARCLDSALHRTHPLTSGEVAQGKVLLGEYPQVEQALNVMEAIIVSYIEDVFNAVSETQMKDVLGPLLSSIYAFAAGPDDFRHVLTLAILDGAKEDLRKGSSSLKGCHLQSGVQKVFDIHAFEYRTNKKVSNCPWSGSFQRIWDSELVRHEDGSWALTGQQKPGGFFDAVMFAAGERRDPAVELGACPFHKNMK